MMLLILLPLVMASSLIDSPIHVMDILRDFSGSSQGTRADSPAPHVALDVAPETTAVKDGEIELKSKTPSRRMKSLIQVLSNSQNPVNSPQVFKICYRMIADFLGAKEILRIVLRHLQAPRLLMGPEFFAFCNENASPWQQIMRTTGLAFIDWGRFYRLNAGNDQAIKLIKSLGRAYISAKTEVPRVQVERNVVRLHRKRSISYRALVAAAGFTVCLSLFLIGSATAIFVHRLKNIEAIVNATGRF